MDCRFWITFLLCFYLKLSEHIFIIRKTCDTMNCVKIIKIIFMFLPARQLLPILHWVLWILFCFVVFFFCILASIAGYSWLCAKRSIWWMLGTQCGTGDPNNWCCAKQLPLTTYRNTFCPASPWRGYVNCHITYSGLVL